MFGDVKGETIYILVSRPSPRPSAVAVMLSSATWPGYQMTSRLTRHSTAKSTYL